MIENGKEYVLDQNPNRATSIIVRPGPNVCTLIQRTANGAQVMDLSEIARMKLAEILGVEVVPYDDPVGEAEPPRRRGRPPKAAS